MEKKIVAVKENITLIISPEADPTLVKTAMKTLDEKDENS